MVNHAKHVLLLIGEVPLNHREEVKASIPGLSTEVQITHEQACADPYALLPLLREGDRIQFTSKLRRRYFMILTGGFPPETVGAVIMDEASWGHEDNLFINGPEALFGGDLPRSVARPIGILEMV